MRDCGCRWDGNLDGRLLRCKQHQLHYKVERQARKQAEAEFHRLLGLGTELLNRLPKEK